MKKEAKKRGRKPLFRREVLNEEKDIVQTIQEEDSKYTVCLFLTSGKIKKDTFPDRLSAINQMRDNRKLYKSIK